MPQVSGSWQERSMKRLAAFADRILFLAAVGLMLAMLASVVLGVVSRHVSRPLSWTDEMAQYLLVWTGFAGWIIASRRGGHIRILAVANRLGGKPRALLEVMIQLAVASMGAAILFYSFSLIQRNLDVESISVPFPSAALYLPLPLLGAGLILQACADLAMFLSGSLSASEGRTP
jgi:TRAP-type C4-dicarboxylate transport system permease small subunit